MNNPVFSIMMKELLLEYRMKYAFNGVLLFLVSTIFVGYLSFSGIIDNPGWNALFWIIMLFTSVNVSLKSFVQERGGLLLYYYILFRPQWVIQAKIFYNALLLVVLSVIGLAIYALFFGNPLKNPTLFVLNMVLGVVGLAAILSMMSAIASKAQNNFTLMSILSFPLVLPLLLVTIRTSLSALEGGSFADHWQNLTISVLLSSITFVLSNLLFPYIWRE